MKTIFKVFPVLAASLFLSAPTSAQAGEMGEALGGGCLYLAVPTAAFVGGVAIATRKMENGVDAKVAALSVGAACATGAVIGGYAVTVAEAAEAPTQQDLQKPEAGDEE